MCLAQGPQRSDAGEARTFGASVSSQALYHLAIALPILNWWNLVACSVSIWAGPLENSTCHIEDKSSNKRIPSYPAGLEK